MAAGVKLVMNYAGMKAIMKSPGVLADLMRRGNAVRAAAGHGHMVTSRIGQTRARVSVITGTEGARRREAETRNLTRALDAARG